MKPKHYQTPKGEISSLPNIWDLATFFIIFGLISILAWGASHMNTPYSLGEPTEISLSPAALPGYAIRTVLRMFIALFFSFLFTFIVAPIAAKNRHAEKFIIPLIDILQSIPVLGVLSITIVGFIKLFPNSLLGPECAAIFAVFTSQVWNMTLSFYQSLKMMPTELKDTAAIFHLSLWRKFWRIELPRATPSLLWNAMISLSGGWFFVVASEAISVSNQSILLPGIGSYISVAIARADINAIYYAIFTMFLVILLYDQLLFRPLLTWGERFKHNQGEDEETQRSWFYSLLTKTHWLKNYTAGRYSSRKVFRDDIFSIPLQKLTAPKRWLEAFLDNPTFSYYTLVLWNTLLIVGVLLSSFILLKFVTQTVTISEVIHVFYLGAITGFKVAVLVILASLVWIPIGVWIGLHPRLSIIFQPMTQFAASFPVNLIYPIFVTLIVHYQLNVNIWSSPLMILGTQWYILFNVIAATTSIPKELKLVTENFALSSWLRWKRLILPVIFPYYITGAMATAAGCWNASIVAEVLNWGDNQLVATGLGSYIVQYTSTGDFPRIALGIFVMSCYVIIINRVVWFNLYQLASKRYVLE